MDAVRWRQVQALFGAAREWPAHERESRLAAECAHDPALLADVGALLAADAHPGVLDELRDRLPSLDAVLAEAPPVRIGAYRIARELGSGGMGVVYLGERDDGQFEQRVAIKLIRTTDPTDPLHRRFLAERRILGALRHPNIARLLDGGITARGLPYLVMEYVDGVPITEYCDQRRLDVRERLRLFVDVCAAVQHAHRNLVIHRDLKPGNILVSADGVVHLLDFGIARLLEPAPDDTALVTRSERAMTPGYASPEQVRGVALTTASDIYSLGTLLYELLTGCRPFAVAAGSTAELLDSICHRDPERPSVRVTRAAARAAEGDDGPAVRAAARGTTVDRLRRRIAGDLDGIVLMAMRKEPHRRYASVDLLREDIARHLNGFPVRAHRGSRRYRLEKLIRRHRAEFAAAVLVVLALVAGLGVALAQARIAGLERDRAERARGEAEVALAQSQEITDFLMELFRTAESNERADAVTVLDLLQRGTARADALAGQPAVQARLLDVLGRLWTRLGVYDEAHGTLQRAVALRTSHPGRDSLDLASSLIHLAHVHRSLAREQPARALVARALAIRRAALPPDHPELSAALHEMGWLSYGEEQERYYREALDVLRRADALPERQVDLLHGLATNLRRRGEAARAIATDREALDLATAAFGPDHATTGYAMIHLADQIGDLEGDVVEAERLYRRGLELMSRQLGDRDVGLVHGLHGLGRLLADKGEHDSAEMLFRRIVAIRIAATGPEHPLAAESQRLLAEQLARSGRLDEAEALAREALALARRVRGDAHPTIPTLFMSLLANIAERRGHIDEADRLFGEAVAMRDNVNLVRDYGRFLTRHGEYGRAESHLLSVLATQERFDRSGRHPSTLETRRALMELYTAWGRPADVERHRVPDGRFVAY